jgi:hypothetical protein
VAISRQTTRIADLERDRQAQAEEIAVLKQQATQIAWLTQQVEQIARLKQSASLVVFNARAGLK